MNDPDDEWPGRQWPGDQQGPGAPPAGLGEVEGVVMLDGVDRWTPAELDAARTVLSGGALDRPAVVDGERVSVDAAVDGLVARLAAVSAVPALRFRLSGLDAATLEAAQSAAAFQIEAVFYIDGEPGAVDGGVLYDLYEEMLFDDFDEP